MNMVDEDAEAAGLISKIESTEFTDPKKSEVAEKIIEVLRKEGENISYRNLRLNVLNSIPTNMESEFSSVMMDIGIDGVFAAMGGAMDGGVWQAVIFNAQKLNDSVISEGKITDMQLDLARAKVNEFFYIIA